jgi:hypothetical protein
MLLFADQKFKRNDALIVTVKALQVIRLDG